jgi:acyl phosphate:glycerol-3-phosphate acyltransferase
MQPTPASHPPAGRRRERLAVIRDLVVFLLGYLVGSIPIGLWLGYIIGGVDVRTVGSGRTGATNVQRSLGTGAAVAVLVLDFVKGMVPVVAVSLATGNPYLAGLAGIAAVVGHIWPLFAGFRGGRGVATAGGALAPLVPFALLVTLVVLVAVVALTRYVSLGSIVSATLVPVVVMLLRGHASPNADAGILMAFVTGSLILLMHAENLGRLMRGRENKLGHKPP